MRWKRDGYTISTDDVSIDVVHGFLREAYWSTGVPREIVEDAVRASLCFSLFRGDPDEASSAQVGFARVVTDRATFAWIADVFVLPEFRGRGLAVWLIATVVAHPDLQRLRQIVLATRDAHGLYARFGFQRAPDGRYMVLRRTYQT